MKILGAIFVLIAIGCALVGLAEAGDGHYENSIREAAEGVTQRLNDSAKVLRVIEMLDRLATGVKNGENRDSLAQLDHEIEETLVTISIKETRELVTKAVHNGELDTREQREAFIQSIHRSDQKLAATAHENGFAEEDYQKKKAERDDIMKWHYGPAACLAVIGSILLVVPRQKQPLRGSPAPAPIQ